MALPLENEMRINKTQAEIKEYFPDITDAIGDVIPGFMTERECREYASSIGWGSCDIIRIEKRFERVYIVGKNDIRKITDTAGITNDAIVFPLGEYDDKGNMRVIKIKKQSNE